MHLEQVSDNCFAVLNEKNRVCDANSGLINRAGGVVIDTQSDLAHARQMIELFGKVWAAMPKRVINTHEDADHVWGNQLFHVPKERVVFAGDVLFRQCTPMGWTGSYEKWFQCMDLIAQLDPAVIVPGHGPLCGMEGVTDLKAYLQYVRDESKKCFDEGLPSLEASKRIEFGPYGEWRAPARLYMNVERAYREFRNEPADAPWDTAATFDAIYQVAKAKGIEVEF